MAKSTFQKFLEAGAQFTDMSKRQAESLVKNLVKEGEVRRKDAEQTVQTLLDRGKATAEHVAALVQKEVAKQVGAFSERFDEVEDRVEALAARLHQAPRAAKKSTAKKSTAKKSTAKKTAAKKTAAKKTAAKKSTAKKTAAKKTAAKKTTAKKTAAKSTAKKTAGNKAVGSSGVRKVATSRQP
ncbi:MAG TPA: hypothetical protein VMQ81_03370 [Acidimicrobiia bacterium]|nr:hypothetical protein [Acidimicrobiia bacterium]